MGRFWWTRGFFKMKRAVTTIMTGAESVLHTQADYKAFDRVLLVLMRKPLRGKRCEKVYHDDGEVEYRTIHNEVTWNKFSIVPMELEAKIRRNPTDHRQALAALTRVPGGDDYGDIFDNDGRVIEAASPYMAKVQADLDSLIETDEAPAIASFLRLFDDAQLAEDFLLVDVTILRARFLAAAIAPVGTTQRSGGDESASSEGEKKDYGGAQSWMTMGGSSARVSQLVRRYVVVCIMASTTRFTL